MTPLRILFQDEHLVAIDKPAGLLVHPGKEDEGPEWIAMKRLRDQLGRQVHPVHRLDRPTCGVLLFALDRPTCGRVQSAFESREVEKTYFTVVFGGTPSEWECDTPLSRVPEEAPAAAHTSFRRLAVAAPTDALVVSLVEAKPATGRFHQIRRHLAEAGHPIVGDYRYADIARCDHAAGILGTGTRMMLQAKSLDFMHPYEGRRVQIEAPADPLFVALFPGEFPDGGRR